MNSPRLTSETRFPHQHAGGPVCYIELRDGVLSYAHYRDDLRDAVRRAAAGLSTLHAAWPGSHRTDLFTVDDLPALAAKIGVELPA